MKSKRTIARLRPMLSERNLYLLIFAFLWVYIWLRAAYTQLTHDETATFFRYVQLGKFLPFASEWSANNHILNSLLSWVFYSVFGPGTLVLRLGNILAFPVFFYFLVKTAESVSNRFLRISFVVVLSMTHNLLEFFAMSRGYGLSMAFLLAAFWHLCRSLEQTKAKDFFLTMIYALLALTANLTLLNSLIIFIALLGLKLLQQKKPIRESWQHWLSILIPGAGSLIFFSVYLFALQERGQLYYGLTTGFWEVSVRTLINTMLDPGSNLIEIMTGIYFSFILIFGLYFFFRKISISNLFSKHLLFFYLLLGNILAAFLLKNLFGVNYPEDRTGLYFVLYFVGSFFFIADLLLQKFRQKSILLLGIPFYFIPLHFLLNMNLSHNSFENHKIPISFYKKVYDSYEPGKAPPTLGGYKAREFRWAYHNFRHGGKLGKVHGSLYPGAIEEFQIVDTGYAEKYRKYYDSIDYHETSGLYLLKRKEPLPRELIFKKEQVKTDKRVNHEYLNLLELKVDSLANANIRIVFNLVFNTKAKPFKSWLVASVRDSSGQEIRYEYFALDWLKYNWEGSSGQVLNSMIVPFPKESHTLVFYLWNIQKKPYKIKGGSISLFKYQLDF